MTNEEIMRLKIKNLITDKGFNLKQISKMLGRSEAYMQQYVTRGHPRWLNEIDRKNLSQILNISEQEISHINLEESKPDSNNVNIDTDLLEYLIDKVETWIENQNIVCLRKEKVKLIRFLYEEFQDKPKDKRKN